MALHRIPPPTEPLTPDEYRWYTALWNAVEPPRSMTVRQIITASLKVIFGLVLLIEPPGFMDDVTGTAAATYGVGAVLVIGGSMALAGSTRGWAAVEELGLRLSQIGLLLTFTIIAVALWEGTHGRASIAILVLLVLMAVVDADKRITIIKWRPVRTITEE